MAGYRLIAAVGAFLGANLIITIINNPILSSTFARGLIGQGILFMGLASFLYELIPPLRNFSPFRIRNEIMKSALLAFILGFAWQSYIYVTEAHAAFSIVLKGWLIFVLPTIFLMGVPIMLLADFLTLKQKGPLFCFISGFAFSIIALLIIFKLDLFGRLAGLLRFNYAEVCNGV